MEQGFENLLRHYGQGAATQSGAANPTVATAAHLDADELGAFAEGVLPSAARLRYTAHLADCARCRLLVSELARGMNYALPVKENLVAAAVNEAAPPIVAASSGGWRALLGGLFAAPALRFALPALLAVGLTVGGIALFYNSRSNEPALVARTENYRSTAAPPATVATDNSSTSPAPLANEPRTPSPSESAAANSNATLKSNAANPAQSGAPEAKTDKAKTAARAQSEEVELARSAPPPPPPAPSLPINGRDERAIDLARERTADDSATGAQPTPVAGVAVAKRSDKPATDRDAETGGVYSNDNQTARAETAPPADETRSTGNNATAGSASTAARRTAPRAVSRPAPSAGTGGAVAVNESRSVAGHKFYRRANVWTDENYRGQPTVNVTRGSDAFRQLGKETPVIKTVADSLAGEVILALNSRAYRIR